MTFAKEKNKGENCYKWRKYPSKCKPINIALFEFSLFDFHLLNITRVLHLFHLKILIGAAMDCQIFLIGYLL
jgi:hypothetical protein